MGLASYTLVTQALWGECKWLILNRIKSTLLLSGDIHYSSTLPMQHNPTLGQTDANGELAGLAGVHVVDGSCLSALTEKSHTLTIMANADRIGKILAKQINVSVSIA